MFQAVTYDETSDKFSKGVDPVQKRDAKRPERPETEKLSQFHDGKCGPEQSDSN